VAKPRIDPASPTVASIGDGVVLILGDALEHELDDNFSPIASIGDGVVLIFGEALEHELIDNGSNRPTASRGSWLVDLSATISSASASSSSLIFIGVLSGA
jgi:hypothetical protein